MNDSGANFSLAQLSSLSVNKWSSCTSERSVWDGTWHNHIPQNRRPDNRVYLHCSAMIAACTSDKLFNLEKRSGSDYCVSVVSPSESDFSLVISGKADLQISPYKHRSANRHSTREQMLYLHYARQKQRVGKFLWPADARQVLEW